MRNLIELHPNTRTVSKKRTQMKTVLITSKKRSIAELCNLFPLGH